MVFHKFLWSCPQLDNEFKEYEKEISTSKWLRSWNLRPKPTSTICFWPSLLIISIEDLNLISIFEYSTQKQRSSWKEIQLKQYFATTFRPLTKKNMALAYRITFLVHFIMLAPTSNFRLQLPIINLQPSTSNFNLLWPEHLWSTPLCHHSAPWNA